MLGVYETASVSTLFMSLRPQSERAFFRQHWGKRIRQNTMRCVAEENMSHNTSIQALFTQTNHHVLGKKIICFPDPIQLLCLFLSLQKRKQLKLSWAKGNIHSVHFQRLIFFNTAVLYICMDRKKSPPAVSDFITCIKLKARQMWPVSALKMKPSFPILFFF